MIGIWQMMRLSDVDRCEGMDQWSRCDTRRIFFVFSSLIAHPLQHLYSMVSKRLKSESHSQEALSPSPPSTFQCMECVLSSPFPFSSPLIFPYSPPSSILPLLSSSFDPSLPLPQVLVLFNAFHFTFSLRFVFPLDHWSSSFSPSFSSPSSLLSLAVLC